MFWDSKIKKARDKLELSKLEHANKLIESLPSWVKDSDESEWTSLTRGKEIYSETNLSTLREQASLLYYTNPLAKNTIETLVKFIIGKSMKITPENPEDEAVKEYWDEFTKLNEFDRRNKEFVRRTFRDGEQFTRFFDDGDIPKIRFIDPKEIKDKSATHSHGIETDPDDVETPVRYYREFTKGTVLGDEKIEADQILHTKILVDSNVKRGISFYIGIAKFMEDYMGWLQDRIKINKMRTIFNVIGKVTGPSSLDTVKGLFQDTSPGIAATKTGTYQKKLPKSGGVLLESGIEWDLKNLNINAGDASPDGRAILLMIVVGSGMAEYMVTGDSSNSNYASTMVSESPAVKTFEDWQDFFELEFKELYRKVIEIGISNGKLVNNTSLECNITFPMLIHRDIEKETKSLQMQRSMNWISDKTASETLGYDYEEELKKIGEQEKKVLEQEVKIFKEGMHGH